MDKIIIATFARRIGHIKKKKKKKIVVETKPTTAHFISVMEAHCAEIA
jgi:hypothetical protein